MSIIFSGTVSVPHTRETTDSGTGKDFEAEVVVFNCDCHTYQEVISLFCQFIPGMTPARAFELAWQIDHEGSASVFQGDLNRADAIGNRLAGGGLRIEVRH